MSDSRHDREPAMSEMIELFKALGDETRLRILAHLSRAAATVTDLAEILDLKPPTVSHHLARLKAAGLVSAEADGTSRYYSFRADGLANAQRRLARMSETLDGRSGVEAFDEDEALEAWERKVLATFVDDDRIVQLPSSRKKRDVLVRAMAKKFEFERDYPEAEVNEIVQQHHPDSAFFRRMMVEQGLMTRSRGVYRRIPVTGD